MISRQGDRAERLGRTCEPITAEIGVREHVLPPGALLNITSVDPACPNRYDFITDVYEHICPPISTAFENAYRLLKPGGVMIFTVPYVEGKTREHFPNVREFSVQLEGKTAC
jgi:hypothetical protein